jgi:hypothetical protein
MSTLFRNVWYIREYTVSVAPLFEPVSKKRAGDFRVDVEDMERGMASLFLIKVPTQRGLDVERGAGWWGRYKSNGLNPRFMKFLRRSDESAPIMWSKVIWVQDRK